MDDEERITEISREALRQAELHLQAQLQVALSADQRAVGLVSVLGPLGTAAIGYAVVRWWGDSPDMPIVWAAMVTGVLFALAAVACAYTARPVRFNFPGNRTSNWWDDGVAEKTLAECLQTEGRNYDAYIIANRARMDRSTRALNAGLTLAVVAPFLGLLTLLLATWAT